jgi:hypothetical protein
VIIQSIQRSVPPAILTCVSYRLGSPAAARSIAWRKSSCAVGE